MSNELTQVVMEERFANQIERRKTEGTFNSMLNLEPVKCNSAESELEVIHCVNEWEKNVNGTMHGGVITGVLDSAMGILCQCIVACGKTPSVGLNVSFYRPVKVGDQLHVRASLLRRTRTLVWLRAEAWVENDKKLCAAAEGVFYVIAEKQA